MTGSSCTQPEIFDVPETIITINAQNGTDLTGSPASPCSENVHHLSIKPLTGNDKVVGTHVGVELSSSHGSGTSLQERLSKVTVFEISSVSRVITG